MSTEAEKENVEDVVESPDIDFKPLVSLPLMKLNTLEDNEDEVLKLRAKLYRFDVTEWKERGVGDVKLMKNRVTQNVRLVMRRDKTHKICANHLLTKEMSLVSCAGSDKAWVWTVLADFADEEPKKEQLAIRFKNAEIAKEFKDTFERCQEGLSTMTAKRDETANGIARDLEKLAISEADEGNTRTSDDKTTEQPKEETQDDSKKETKDDKNDNDTENITAADEGNTS